MALEQFGGDKEAYINSKEGTMMEGHLVRAEQAVAKYAGNLLQNVRNDANVEDVSDAIHGKVMSTFKKFQEDARVQRSSDPMKEASEPAVGAHGEQEDHQQSADREGEVADAKNAPHAMKGSGVSNADAEQKWAENDARLDNLLGQVAAVQAQADQLSVPSSVGLSERSFDSAHHSDTLLERFE